MFGPMLCRLVIAFSRCWRGLRYSVKRKREKFRLKKVKGSKRYSVETSIVIIDSIPEVDVFYFVS
jgi:hypothetical protein